MIPFHHFKRLIDTILDGTPFTYSDIDMLVDPTEPLKKNCERIVKRLGGLNEGITEFLHAKGYSDTYTRHLLRAMRNNPHILPHIPKWKLEQGIKPLQSMRMQWEDFTLFGIDTETSNNDRIDKDTKTDIMQVWSEDVQEIIEDVPCDEHFLHWFLDKYDHVIHTKHVAIGLFNSSFDLAQMFGRHIYKLVREQDKELKACSVGMNRGFAVFKIGKRFVYFIDCGNFFRGKLQEVAAAYFPYLPKLERPSWLGQRQPQTQHELEYYNAYSLRDAELTYLLLCKIRDMQNLESLSLCVTAPSMSGKLIRMEMERPILYPSIEQMNEMIKSKTGAVTLAIGRGTTPFDCMLRDVFSLYPFIMCTQPYPFSPGHETKYITTYKQHVWMDGIDGDRYEGTCYAETEFPRHVLIPSIMVRRDVNYLPRCSKAYTSFGLVRLAKRLGATVKIHEKKGTCWKVHDIDMESPLKRVISRYIDKKLEADLELEPLKKKKKEIGLTSSETERFSVLTDVRTRCKLIVNSGSGKFGEINEGDAGYMYHPMFSIQTLDYSKAYVICSMNMFHAAYGDTDSMVSPLTWPSFMDKMELGSWTDELGGERHTFRIVRSKIYDDLDGDKEGHHSVQFTGSLTTQQEVPFQTMNREAFKKLLDTAEGETARYSRIKMTGIKETEGKGISPNTIVVVNRTFAPFEDQKRVYEQELISFQDLRTNFTWSTPPERLDWVKREEMTDEEREILHNILRSEVHDSVFDYIIKEDDAAFKEIVLSDMFDLDSVGSDVTLRQHYDSIVEDYWHEYD